MKRYKHSLSNQVLTTANMGQLIPIGIREVLPGDTIQHHVNVLCRVAPMAAPVMHPVTARVHHFFIPTRLAADQDPDGFDWESFITGGEDGNDAQLIPTLTTTGVAKDLLDYLEIPPVAGVEVNAMPVWAFNLAFNEFYRDQDLVPKRDIDDLTIPQIAWEKDYFSSARPWTQKGSDVTLPLGEKAAVHVAESTNSNKALSLYVDQEQALRQMNSLDGSVPVFAGGAPGTEGTSLYADLAEAIGANVNDVRRAFAIQRYQENRARYGSRYSEYLRFLTGTTPPDGRLQRPEFLGGGRTQLNFSEVMQTSPTYDNEGTAREYGVGDLYGHGIAAMRSNAYRRTMPEHGFVITLFSVRPKAIYTNGIHKMWLKQHKEDYFQRELQHIGQQEILNNEIFADAASGDETFGYQDRYSEYRSQPSKVTGEFRDTLDYWHLARQFSTTPTLNQSFVDCVPSKRIFNEQTQDSLWITAQHKCVARRLVSRNATSRIY